MPSHSTIPIPPTPTSPAYNNADNRMSTASGMSGYGTSAIGAMLTAPHAGGDGESAYSSDSDGEDNSYGLGGPGAAAARARLRHQVSKQNKSGGSSRKVARDRNADKGDDDGVSGAHGGHRVMSPMSDYSELDREGNGSGQRDTRAVSGVWATASNGNGNSSGSGSGNGATSPLPYVPSGARLRNDERTEELDAPSMTYAKGGDRRSVALRQVPQHYTRSIAGELDQASLSNAGSDAGGRVSAGPSVVSPGPGPAPVSPGPASHGRSYPASPVRGLSEEVREQDLRKEHENKFQGASGIMKRQGEQVVDQYHGKRITIVDFPAPSFGANNKGDYAKAPGVGDISFDQSHDGGQGHQQQHQYQRQPQPHHNLQHGPHGAYGNADPSYPAQTHPGPVSSPHLRPMPSPSPSYSTLPMSTSNSLPSLHISSLNHSHYPSSPSHAGGSFGQGSYSRLASSSPNLGPSGPYGLGHGHGGLTPPHPITIDLPPPQSPISPMLAAPPSARVGAARHMQSATPSSMMSATAGAGGVSSIHSAPPGTPGSGGGGGGGGGPFQGNASRLSISSTNESVRGFDFLKEKNALFRGGEEDILGFNPRGPQKRSKPGRSGLRGNGAASRLMTTVDFWKRMSVMRVQGQGDGGKERYVGSAFSRGAEQ